MKFAILGDIHANLEALTAVLEDAASQGATHHVCTGDIVGYNTNPHECVEIIRALRCPIVRGNLDEDASGDNEIVGLNPLARHALEWTREHLTREDKAWLRSHVLVRQVHDFTIVHATLDTPSSWAYVMNKFDAMASFSYQFTPVCFYGHTHTPRIYIKGAGGITTEDPSLPLPIESGRKYFINTGSVGQPRDGDWRAAYALYDIDNCEVTIRRVPYDLDGLQTKIRNGPLGPQVELRE